MEAYIFTEKSGCDGMGNITEKHGIIFSESFSDALGIARTNGIEYTNIEALPLYRGYYPVSEFTYDAL